MVARWQEPGPAARRFTFGSGVDSEFSGEVVRTRFGQLRASCRSPGTVQKRASRKPRPAQHSTTPRFLQADFWPRTVLRGTTVAVGTTITDRPPHRSVRARLR